MLWFSWFRSPTARALERLEHKLDQLGVKIMANAQETKAGIDAVNQQLQKIGNESALLLQRIADLEAAVQNGNVSQEITDSLNALKQQAQVVDDLVPDAEPGVLEGGQTGGQGSRG